MVNGGVSRVFLYIWGNSPLVRELGATGIGLSWASGDRIANTRARYRRPGWRYLSAGPSTEPISDQLERILGDLSFIWPQVLAAAKEGQASLSLALYVDNDGHPEWGVTATQILRLAELNAELDISVYPLAILSDNRLPAGYKSREGPTED